MYQPLLMLRTLGPQDMTAAQQREADEQLGQNVAAAARRGRRLAARAHAVTTKPVRAGRRLTARARVVDRPAMRSH
jgi:hypothetical protein